MDRVTKLNVVQKSVKLRSCGACGREIPIGSKYYIWSRGYRRGDNVRCERCRPNPWELESNSKRASLVEAEYHAGKAQEALDAESAAMHMQSAIEAAQAARDEFQESVDLWSGTNFEYGQRAEEFSQAIEDLDAWISTAEDSVTSLNDFDAVRDSDDPDDEEAQQVYDEGLANELGNIEAFPSIDFS